MNRRTRRRVADEWKRRVESAASCLVSTRVEQERREARAEHAAQAVCKVAEARLDVLRGVQGVVPRAEPARPPRGGIAGAPRDGVARSRDSVTRAADEAARAAQSIVPATERHAAARRELRRTLARARVLGRRLGRQVPGSLVRG